MKQLLTLIFMIILAIPCFAIGDTLDKEIAFITAVKKAKESDQKAQLAMKEFEKADKEAKRLRQELDQAEKAYSKAENPEAKQEAMKIISAITDSLIVAVDRAAFAEFRSQKALEELKFANQRASELDRKISKR
jgi:hypothetical protein